MKPLWHFTLLRQTNKQTKTIELSSNIPSLIHIEYFGAFRTSNRYIPHRTGWKLFNFSIRYTGKSRKFERFKRTRNFQQNRIDAGLNVQNTLEELNIQKNQKKQVVALANLVGKYSNV